VTAPIFDLLQQQLAQLRGRSAARRQRAGPSLGLRSVLVLGAALTLLAVVRRLKATSPLTSFSMSPPWTGQTTRSG
jgi:hypothetical protein